MATSSRKLKLNKFKLKAKTLIPVIIGIIYLGHILGLSLNYFGILAIFALTLFYLYKFVPSLSKARLIAITMAYISLLLIAEKTFHPGIIDYYIPLDIFLIGILVLLAIFSWHIYEGSWLQKLIYNLVVSGVIYLVTVITFVIVFFVTTMISIDGFVQPRVVNIRSISQESTFTYIVDGCVDYGGSAATYGGVHAFKVRYTNLILWELIEYLPIKYGCA